MRKSPLVQRFISEDHLPHLLFYGPPGTGKTSTILACAKMLYSAREFNAMVLEVHGYHLTNPLCVLRRQTNSREEQKHE